MIDATFVEAIASLKENAAEVKVAKLEGFHRKVIISQGEDYDILESPAPVINCVAKSIGSLAKIVNDYALNIETDAKCSVWHTEGAIVGVLNDDERLHRVTMKLTTDARFSALQKIESGASFDQKAFRQWLLLVIGRRAIQTNGLLDSIQRVKFDKTEGGEGTINATSVGMGRSIMAKATGAADIPETFVVRSQVYVELPAIVVEVELQVDVDPIEQVFRVRPIPGELQLALQKTHAEIEQKLIDELDETSTRVLYGSP